MRLVALSLLFVATLAAQFSICRDCEGFPVKYRRSSAEVRAFRKTHPCPATGKTTGACKGYVVDHIVALGCADTLNTTELPVTKKMLDVRLNMQWQDVAAGKRKDRTERKPAECQRYWRQRKGLLIWRNR